MVVIDEKEIEQRLDQVRNKKHEIQLRLELLETEENDIETFLRVLRLFAKPELELRQRDFVTAKINAKKEFRQKSNENRKVKKRHPGVLKRNQLDAPQNLVARKIIQNFEPGAIVTARAVADKTEGQIEHPRTAGGYAHWLSAFLNKEAQCMNGILERIEGPRGHYRLKEDPQQFLR